MPENMCNDKGSVEKGKTGRECTAETRSGDIVHEPGWVKPVEERWAADAVLL